MTVNFKRHIALLLIVICLLSLAACKTADPDDGSAVEESESQSEEYSEAGSEESTANEETSADEEAEEEVSAAYEAYITATELTVDDLEKTSTGYEYEGLPGTLVSQDVEWIESSLNTGGTVENGALYRKMAILLEAFEFNNAWETFSTILLGFVPESKDECTPYVENAKEFIVSDGCLVAVMTKLSTLSSVTGEFDFDTGNFGNYDISITDLTVCADEMMISEEMLGYILAALTEYGVEISFEENRCTLIYDI